MTAIGLAAEGWLTGRLARREISELTERGYRYSLNQFVEFVGPGKPVGDVDTLDFESWLASLDLAPGALNTRAAPVRAFMEWCTLRGMSPVNPTKGVARARTPRRFPRRIEPGDVTKLLHVADFRQRTIIMLGLHLGLRRCEVSRANIEHWRRRDGTLWVHGKGDKERVVPIGDELAEILGLWVQNLPAGRGPLFPSQHGYRIGPNRVGSLVTEAARTAGVRATTHRLRHTCASDLVAAGVPLPVVQQLLGHESLTTTTIYTTATAQELRQFVTGRRYGAQPAAWLAPCG